MKAINYLKGDATKPQQEGNQIIAHICNDIGGWGKGFVLAISKKWKEPEISFRAWFKEKEGFDLGQIQLVRAEEQLWVANMIGQSGIYANADGLPPIRYDAVQKCLEALVKEALYLNASVHLPRIGCGLAGGKWEKIELIIIQTLCQNNIKTFVYDL